MEQINRPLLVFGTGKAGIPSIPSFYVRFHLQFGLLLRLWSNHSLAPRQGSLSAKTQFVGQRHTLPISRVDTIEVSTLLGCLLRDVTSMYYSRLQSYGRFSNISLSEIFTLFPRISLHFIAVIKSAEISFILQSERANNGMMIQVKDTSYYRWLTPKMTRTNETYS